MKGERRKCSADARRSWRVRNVWNYFGQLRISQVRRISRSDERAARSVSPLCVSVCCPTRLHPAQTHPPGVEAERRSRLVIRVPGRCGLPSLSRGLGISPYAMINTCEYRCAQSRPDRLDCNCDCNTLRTLYSCSSSTSCYTP